MAMAIATAFHPQTSLAEGFTGKEFLEWSEKEQRGYLDAQLVMASSIAARIKPPLAACIATSYYGESGLSLDGFRGLISAIGDYGDYHPSTVLVVLIEQACEQFN